MSLHTAVLENSDELLEVLLQETYVDVNCKNNEGKTPLLKSINMYRSDSFITRLLEAGSDPNIPDKYRETPLYAAATRPTTKIAHELIKLGANINSTTKELNTPLHQAVDYNFEIVCLLLYFGADVNVLSKNNMTPFMNALSCGDSETSEVLINYYDQDDCLSKVGGYTSLYFAMKSGSLLAMRLVTMGADVNYVSPYGENLLLFSLFYYSKGTLFKLIWDKFDWGIILDSERPFVLSYLETCCFQTCDWVECLRLILQSSIAFQLFEHYSDYMRHKELGNFSFFQELLKNFHWLKVEPSDRIAIIYIVLNLGVEVTIHDINTAYDLYGFKDELDIFIYFINWDIAKYSEFKFILLPNIFALDDNFDVKTAQTVFWLHNLTSTSVESQADTEHDWLRFFNRTHYLNFFKMFPALWKLKHSKIIERLQFVPDFPSLLELSWNQARNFIRQVYKIKRPYHFHDTVNSLNLPQRIKDILRFKTPIYK